MKLSVLEPFPILETPRLTLRQIEESDAEALMAIFGDPQVTETTDLDAFEKVEQAINLITNLDRRYQNKQAIRWAVVLKETNQPIGTCGFNYFDTQSNRSEIGYDLARAYWGCGLTTEAVRTMLDFGFQQLEINRIEATTNLFNVASIKVLHKFGFREEGILYQYGFWRNQYHDLRMFSLLKKSWQQLGK